MINLEKLKPILTGYKPISQNTGTMKNISGRQSGISRNIGI